MTARCATTLSMLRPSSIHGAIACLVLAIASLPAAAATITVDTLAQVDPAKCTLASAIKSANDDVNVAGCVRVGGIGADTIALPTGTYALTVPDNGAGADLTGLPIVTSDITILGNGSTITRTNGTAAPFFRIFTIATTGTLTLVEVTVSGGRLVGSDSTARLDGGGISVLDAGSLALNRAAVRDNHIGPNVKIGQGGGIGAHSTCPDTCVPGSVTLTDSTVSDNSVTAQQTVAENQALGGGIGISNVNMAITRSRITNNLASTDAKVESDDGGLASGGGIAMRDSGLTLSFVTISDNTVSARGGNHKGGAAGGGVDYLEVAVRNGLGVRDCTFSNNVAVVRGGASQGPPGAGAGGGAISYVGQTQLNIVRTSFIQNTAQADGAGTFNDNGSFAHGGAIRFTGFSLSLQSSTLVNNGATSRPGPGGGGGVALGGAIDVLGASTQLTLSHVTMTGNFVDAPAGGTALGGGISSTDPVFIGRSIVIGNSAPADCSATSNHASFTSSGNNINPASGSCGVPVASDKPGVDPQFGPLVSLVRPAGQYLPLLATSPAVDFVTPCTPVDQIGQKSSGACDIGAVERVPDAAVFAAILPSTRAGVLGTKLTAFVTVLNAGPTTAYRVGIDLVTPVPALYFYDTTDALNVPTGDTNTPVDIPPNGSQTFFVSVMPTAPFPPTELVFAFKATNAAAPSLVGLNTLLVSASVTPIPDLVALVATIGNNGIVDIPSSNSTGIFTLATVNLGSSDLITVSTDTGGATVPLTTLVCQTDPAGACLQPPAAAVTTQIDTGATPTFGFFVISTGPVPFDPGGTRLFVRLKDSTGAIRGGSSVAPRTLP